MPHTHALHGGCGEAGVWLLECRISDAPIVGVVRVSDVRECVRRNTSQSDSMTQAGSLAK